MEDDDLSRGTVLENPANSIMDFDYVDELLLEGCWLETTDGSEFLNTSPANSAPFVDPTFAWFASDTNNVDSTSCQSQRGNQEDKQMSLLPGDLPFNEIQKGSLPNTQTFDQNVIGIGKLGNNPCESSELNRRWWIGPGAHPGTGTSVMERLIKVIWYIKDLAADEDVLIQIWVPANRGGRCVLTTCDQPFALDPGCQKLASYRDISVNYQFSAEEDAKDFVGLPGRVFLDKVPEWTPNVQYFRSDEYLRVYHAQQHNVRGSLALPIFEQGSRICLGVIEVVMTTQKAKYQPELESVCKALEAVDLRCSEILSTRNVKVCDVSYEAVLPEIQEVLRSSCEMHGLPLAQTWVPCIQQGKGGSRHSDKNYTHCVSTVDRACYVADPDIQGFQDACSEHHLLRGQGVVGQAFMTNQPCFSSDITLISKTDYPLSHHARMFGLCAAVAIRLRSVGTSPTDFVLEFFLPVYCRNLEEQKKMLTLLSTIIQLVCRTLRVITDRELEDEISVPASKVAFASNGRSSSEGMPTKKLSHSERQHQENYSQNGSAQCGGDYIFDAGSFASAGMQKITNKKQTMAEKAITPQVLQQYFSGSLKDAAKSIGVCPTTLKRICRQHGITRWPSRKIKKVGNSLQKLQLVIDSVQGASGAFHTNSFYANFPELGCSKSSKSGSISTSKLSDHLEPSTSIQPEGGITSFQATTTKAPSSSCSQRSSSSHCLSTGIIQQHCSTFSAPLSKDPILGGNSGNGVLKGVRSDEELHAPSAEEREPFPRSLSHKSLLEKHNSGSHQPLPNCNGRSSQDLDGQRAKVTYGNEKIRIRIPNNWKLEDLQTEIARRFNVDGISGFNLKYLDDDAEWVLLSCDEDLEECIDVCRSSQSHTIKLLLQNSLGKVCSGHS